MEVSESCHFRLNSNVTLSLALKSVQKLPML